MCPIDGYTVASYHLGLQYNRIMKTKQVYRSKSRSIKSFLKSTKSLYRRNMAQNIIFSLENILISRHNPDHKEKKNHNAVPKLKIKDDMTRVMARRLNNLFN